MSSAVPESRPARVLACVSCQVRKIKCDRKSPCANCVKGKLECTFRAPVARRRRRQTNLRSRLAKCEDLISEFAQGSQNSESSRATSEDVKPFTPGGHLVVDTRGTTRFAENELWANICREVHAMREILDRDNNEVEQDRIDASTSVLDLNASLILPVNRNVKNVNDLHPDAAHVFPLWQIFLDRVHPLTKIIHVPTFQPIIVKTLTDRRSLSEPTLALLFAIYLMAVNAMDADETLSLLGYTRSEGLDRFSTGVCFMLEHLGLFHSCDLMVLEALILYMYSLLCRYERDAAWILNGVLVRMAQKMGLHIDGESLGLSPFQSEMRRRVWWQIVLLDALYAQMTGMVASPLPRLRGTRKPINIGDSDLYPTMKVLQPKDGPTDMIYCLLAYEVVDFVHAQPILRAFILHQSSGPISPSDIIKAREHIDILGNFVSDIERKYGDRSMSPIQHFAIECSTAVVGIFQEIVSNSIDLSELRDHGLGQNETLWRTSIAAGDNVRRLLQAIQRDDCFVWYLSAQLNVEFVTYIVAQLNVRTSGPLVEKVWSNIKHIYFDKSGLFDVSNKLCAQLGMHVLRAWKNREEMLQASGIFTPDLPEYITRLRRLLPPAD